MSATALVIVDIQNDYFPDGKWPVHNIEAASANAGAALAHARAAGLPVLHVRHEIPVENAPFFQPGTEGAEIHPSVAPRDDEPVITKHFPNSFQATDLEARLRAAETEQIVLAGAMSQMCIDATARAAKDLGFSVRLLHDACAAKEQEFGGIKVPAESVHAAFMAALGSAYAELVATCDFTGDVEES